MVALNNNREQGWLSGESFAFYQCVPGSIPGPGVIRGYVRSFYFIHTVDIYLALLSTHKVN